MEHRVVGWLPIGISCSKNDALKRGNDTGGVAIVRSKNLDLGYPPEQEAESGSVATMPSTRWWRPRTSPSLAPTKSETGSHRLAFAPSAVDLPEEDSMPSTHRRRGVEDVTLWFPVAPRPSPRSRPAAAIASRGSTWEGARRRARRTPLALERLCPAAPFGGDGGREGGWRREVGGG
jgi:hypothetical protein